MEDEEFKKYEEEANKRLLSYEFVICYIALFYFLTLIFTATYAVTDEWLQLALVVIATVLFIIACSFAIKIETEAGYYECENCHNKYVPKYKDVYFAMHMGRTRYLKCPECNKRAWHKKVLTK